jgi:hypothetical protein
MRDNCLRSIEKFGFTIFCVERKKILFLMSANGRYDSLCHPELVEGQNPYSMLRQAQHDTFLGTSRRTTLQDIENPNLSTQKMVEPKN